MPPDTPASGGLVSGTASQLVPPARFVRGYGFLLSPVRPRPFLGQIIFSPGENADLPQRPESRVLAQREEDEKAEFPGLRRFVQVRIRYI